MKPEIVLEIDAAGETCSVEVKGVSGRQCVTTTRCLEDALGEVVCRELKNEYFVERARSRGRIRTGPCNGSGSSGEVA